MPTDDDNSLDRADELLELAKGDYEHDRFSGALKRVEQARTIYASTQNRSGAARCDQRQAMIASDVGDLAAALRLARAALEYFTQTDDHTATAKVHISISASLIRAQQPEDSMLHARAALRFFRQTNVPIEIATCHENLGIAFRLLKRHHHAYRHFERALNVLKEPATYLEDVRYADIQMALAGLEHHEGNSSTAAVLRDSALARYQRLDQPFRQSIQERNIGLSACRDGDYDTGIRWFESARDRLSLIDHHLEAADTARLLAQAELEADRPTWETAELALGAVRELETHRYRLDQPALRQSWLGKHLRAHNLACRVALALDRSEVVAELVETTRQQSRPLIGAPRLETDGPETGTETQAASPTRQTRNAVALAGTGRALGPSRPIAVNGRSHIHQGLPTDAVDLNQLAATAGHDGWLWGTFVHNERIWWYLRDPTGHYDAGVISYAPDSPQRQAVDYLARHHETVASSVDPHRVATDGPLGAVPDLALLASLDALLPPRLIAAANDHSLDSPLVLSMAHDPELASLPWILIPLKRETPNVSLIDRVQTGAAPPAALIPSPQPAPVLSPRRIELAVLDSRDDLPTARQTTTDAVRKLVGDNATKENLRLALKSIEPGAPGITVFATHVVQTHTTAALGTSIQLADGTITAAEFLDDPANGLTDVVHLAGCTSIGLHHREWLGIAAAVLGIGAQAVIASAWPLLDDLAMLTTDRLILQRLQQTQSASGALRDAQLELRPHRPKMGPAQTLPYHWAAYTAVGNHAAATN